MVLKRHDDTLSSSASLVLFSAAVRVRVGGVFVTCRGPGTTGCRPQQPQTGLANIPGRPKTTEAALETDEGRVYLEITCLPCAELN